MSKALIVYGYYDEEDHYGSLLKEIKSQLISKNITDIDVTNTFSFTQQHINNNKQNLAAPTADWFRGHRTPENDELIKSEQDKLLASTHIIFVFPIWWESLPHYMMTWVSEVFRSVSFRVNEKNEPTPMWGGDREVMIITTAGFSQEVRRENFSKLLPSQNLTSLKDKSDSEIDNFITVAQSYPLMMALNYSGLKLTKELHLCEVKSADDDKVISAVRKAMTDFLKSHNAANKVEEIHALSEQPPVVLLSGGPYATPKPQETVLELEVDSITTQVKNSSKQSLRLSF